ncbi:MAG: NAD(P)H-hydrate dehydratase [Methanomassiliicoccales archaeon]|nr:NAD(P)H-hydrate dehydratase [Methanomassiliicoccales archaeon]
MMKWEEVRVLDVNAKYLGVPTETLMENAGWALAQEITSRYGEGLHVAMLCGSGNNGGDGFVAARVLTKSNRVRILLASPPADIRTPEARVNFEKVEELHRVYAEDDLKTYDLLVDALIGIGSQGEPKGRLADMIAAINESGRPVVSVDVPSGLGSKTAVRPMVTVTFHALKAGMSADSCGEIVVKDIGIPADAENYLGPGDLLHYPIPAPDTHKGQNGRVLVVGGGPYTGAPALAGLASYRIGADLVFVACPESVRSTIASYSPNLITIPYPGDRLTEASVERVLPLMEKVDTVLIGPGLGDDPGTLRAVRVLIERCSRPMVLDADGLKAVAGRLDLLRGKKGVLTPHHREMEVIVGSAVPEETKGLSEAAANMAAASGWTVVVKGRVDLVTDGNNIKLNRTGNAGMTVGGTGDVLAGITAGLLAKGASPYNAARMATFVNGAAGDLAFEKFSYGLMATDLLDRIPQVLRKSLSRTR